METIDKIEAVLKDAYPGGEVDLNRLRNGRIIGHVVSSDYLGLDDAERQDHLWTVLRASGLEYDELKKISMIFTLTPEEQAAVAS
jgi:hypothetical protein